MYVKKLQFWLTKKGGSKTIVPKNMLSKRMFWSKNIWSPKNWIKKEFG